MKASFYLSIATLCACFFTACASRPVYHDVKASLTPQPGKGLVLVYFKSGFVGGAAKWHLYNGDQLLTDIMKRGAFYSYQANPGDLRFTTTQNVTYVNVLPSLLGLIPRDQKPIHIDPNQTYYVNFHFGDIKPVSNEEGEKDIQDCEWINHP